MAPSTVALADQPHEKSRAKCIGRLPLRPIQDVFLHAPNHS